ncbi:MAG: N-acetylgalactosamine-6-sulfatase, partial [Planctomycetota bacterium]
IQAAVPMGAQTDLLSERVAKVSQNPNGKVWRQFLGGAQNEQTRKYRLASPLNHLDHTDPPCWFITGQNDDASTHADAFRTKMDGLGISHGITVVPNAPHPFLGKQAWFDLAIDSASAFFHDTLRD